MKNKKAIAIVMSDLHARQANPVCRSDKYFDAMVRKLLFISSLCEENNCMLVDAGDLFDNWKSSPIVESTLLSCLPDFQNFLSVAGNHEMPYHNENRISESSFNVIKLAKGFGCKHIDDDKIIHLYNYSNALPDLYGCDEGGDTKVKIAVWHSMVFENEKIRIDGVDGFTAEEVCSHFSDYDYVITGHNHETFECRFNRTTLINPGSVMRSSISQINHKPCVYKIFDKNTYSKVFIPIEVDVFKEELYRKKKDNEEKMSAFINQLKLPSGMTADFKKNVYLYVSKNKIDDDVKKKISELVEDT